MKEQQPAINGSVSFNIVGQHTNRTMILLANLLSKFSCDADETFLGWLYDICYWELMSGMSQDLLHVITMSPDVSLHSKRSQEFDVGNPGRKISVH